MTRPVGASAKELFSGRMPDGGYVRFFIKRNQFMKTIRNLVSIILSVFLAVGTGILFSGCADSEKDLTILVYNKTDNRLIAKFPPDIDKLEYSICYSGEEIFLRIRYRLADSEVIHDQYESPTSSDWFDSVWLYEDNDGNQDGGIRSIKDKGRYHISIHSFTGCEIWNPRSVELIMHVI